ncbi:MAG TPA: bifunctional riboflavin kinase/FAD synthetase [Chloroflexota bacterium]|nr:bifunctional riboflavin kinase/FAD synthetase [Chloroflexota bacterium]
MPDAPPPTGALPDVAATIGSFDGVHLGHRALLDVVARRAAEGTLSTAVITFDPHPRRVLRPDAPLKLISPLDERLSLFAAVGVHLVLVWRFDERLRSLSPEQFLDELGRYVTLRHLVHGPGFALGRARAGTPEALAALGQQRGFTVEEVPLRHLEGSAPVTSTRVREAIEAGEVAAATEALGRGPTLTGVVVEGEKVGRTLGFPTANLRLDSDVVVPADGVYAAWAELHPFTPHAETHPAAVSIGERPTFHGRRRVVEASLLDFDGDLYGQTLRLHFVTRLRGQERFTSADALINQMHRDVEEASAALVSLPPPAGGAPPPPKSSPAPR